MEAEFPIAIHRRASSGSGLLSTLAQELRATLTRSAVSPPYLLVGHSFGALVVRQYAALYPDEVKALLFVDGPPLQTVVPASLLRKVYICVRMLQLLALFRLAGRILRMIRRHAQAVEWAFAELAKYPKAQQRSIRAEWNTPEFYSSTARILKALPANLQTARRLVLPSGIPMISLHSDYLDPTGRRIENAGHWIQIDQPDAVANAIRELAAMS